MKTIYITRHIPENGIQALKDKGYSVDIGPQETAPTKEELVAALSKKSYDGVISFLTDTIDKELFDTFPTIKIVAQYSVGFDNIDLGEAYRRGVVVTNTPHASSRAVAEHAVALMLALTTKLCEGDTYMRDGSYTGWSPYLFNGTDVTGKVIGILGAGEIGGEVASILHFGFNCTILYSDIQRNDTFENKYGATYVDMDNLLSASDIVSIHIPLSPATKHLIHAEALSKMKPTAYLINTARGPIIDEVELVKALKENRIAGAGLDVYEFEPNLSEGLISLPNVVLTPHIASSRDNARKNMADVVAKNIISFFETGKAINEVKGGFL